MFSETFRNQSSVFVERVSKGVEVMSERDIHGALSHSQHFHMDCPKAIGQGNAGLGSYRPGKVLQRLQS